MPQGATPQSHLAAGPWCFAGREELFSNWDGSQDGPQAGGYFPLPPDPFADAAALDAAARSANASALRLARAHGERLNAELGAGLSSRYWDMAFGPFFLLVFHMLIERQQRLLDLAKAYGGEKLRVELLPAHLPFAFADSLDFMLHGVQDANFNHYVSSRIIEALAPPAWDLAYVQGIGLHRAGMDGQGRAASGSGSMGGPGLWKSRLRAMLGRWLRDLPFPRCKGFSLPQTLILSLAVLRNRRDTPDKSLDFSLYCGREPDWRFDADSLALACLPLALRDAVLPKGKDGAGRGLKGTRGPLRDPLRGPLRGMSPAFTQDDTYRLKLAALRERGGRLFCVQHGANYGNLASLGGIPFEYSQHCFFSWGWRERQGAPANARPLPHPALAAIAGKHREAAPELILVGAEMSSFSYRLKSRPQAGAFLPYRQAKLDFLRAVDQGLNREQNRERAEQSLQARQPDQPPGRPGPAARILYRPYFKVAGGLDDGDFVRRRLPQIALCDGDLTRRMLACRLLALDHYGTTMHMALAANVPLIAFWDRRAWAMDEASDRTLDALQRAGILYDSAPAAARKALAVWPDVAAWWRSETVQAARNLWLERYAQTGDAPDKPWNARQLTWAWFKALRHC